jgi:hypothetical protein
LRGRFRTVTDLERGLKLLETHGYLRTNTPARRPGPGRTPAVVYETNPHLFL